MTKKEMTDHFELIRICDRPKCGKKFTQKDPFMILDDGSFWCPDCADEYRLYESIPCPYGR